MKSIPTKDILVIIFTIFAIIIAEAVIWKNNNDPTIKRQEAEVVKIK